MTEIVKPVTKAGRKAGRATYDEHVRVWARAIIAKQTPDKGGFAPAPVFPISSRIHQAAKTLKGHRLG